MAYKACHWCRFPQQKLTDTPGIRTTSVTLDCFTVTATEKSSKLSVKGTVELFKGGTPSASRRALVAMITIILEMYVLVVSIKQRQFPPSLIVDFQVLLHRLKK